MSEMLGSMLATVRLPESPVLPSLHHNERVARQTVAFILRGLGLKDEVIAAHTSSALSMADVETAKAANTEPSCPRGVDRDH